MSRCVSLTWSKKENYLSAVRKSCLELSCKKDVLKNFAKLAGTSLCRSIYFHKVVGLRPILKPDAPRQLSSCEFCEMLKTPIFIEHLRVTTSVLFHFVAFYEHETLIRLMVSEFIRFLKVDQTLFPHTYNPSHIFYNNET